MKKRIALVAVLAFVLTMCVAFVGCSKKVDASQFLGTWTMTEGTVEGTEFTAADMELLKADGVTATITFDQNATFELAMPAADFSVSGTWTTGKTGLDMKDAIETSYTATLEDSVLTVSDASGENNIKFVQ